MTKEVVSPEILGSVVSTLRKEIDVPYFTEMFPTIPEQISPDRRDQSLGRLCELMTESRLNEFMVLYKKESSGDSYRFCIRPTLKNGYEDINDMDEVRRGRFYMDSDAGLVLGIRDEDGNPLWIGAVGVVLGQELDTYDIFNEENKSKGRMDFQYQFPVIVQLQGPSTASYRRNLINYHRAQEVLGSYKWERALIGLVLEWASAHEVPAVYLLPGDINRWLNKGMRRKFHMRYDVSAKRMGFRVQPNGLYGISLLGVEEAEVGKNGSSERIQHADVARA